jgi:predicted ATPase
MGKLHLRRSGILLCGLIQRGASKSGEKVADILIFLCAEHWSMGSEHISDIPMKLRLAQLNSMVGIKATNVSAFAMSAQCFEKGFELLEVLEEVGNTQAQHHTLCISMYVAYYAEVQYYVGQFDMSLDAIQEVLSHSRPDNA